MSESDEEDKQQLYIVDDDPTIVDNPGQGNKSYWVLNQRDKWLGHFKGSTRLPQDAAKHLGRRYFCVLFHTYCALHVRTQSCEETLCTLIWAHIFDVWLRTCMLISAKRFL